MKTSEIFLKSLEIRNDLKANHDDLANPIDMDLLPVLPFRISDDIKLIIIGQDPTVKAPLSRDKIQYTLNLDKSGSLKTYVERICQKLNICFENVYATNIFKYFYSNPPADTFNVLQKHLPQNLNLLLDEISIYKKAPIITLGLPVLQLLAGSNEQVSHYWDYNSKTKKSNGNFKACPRSLHKLGRDFYPLPHQPSLAKAFYNDTLEDYLSII
jgi:uracil-DNA glycosylase